jgi:hypothetical protein
MIKLRLPFWNDQTSSNKLQTNAQTFWEKIETGLRWISSQTNPETCTLAVLYLVGWQRGIDRFKSEPINLYRKRVRWAYANAADAGSTIGIKRIFERLGVGYIEVEERTPGRDWDIITLRLSDGQLAGNTELLRFIIETYGRTCRRYEFQVITPVVLALVTEEFNNEFTFDIAKQNNDVLVFATFVAAEFENDFSFDVAKEA